MKYDTNSIVDYLKSKGLDSSIEARRGLWVRFDPSEVYTGSASQNTRLLNYFKAADAAPALRLSQPIYQIGDEVEATVDARGPVLLENHFGMTSQQVLPGQQFSLGSLTRAGLFLVSARDGLLQTEMALVAMPGAGGVQVGLWESGYELDDVPTPVPLEPGDEDLFGGFFDNLSLTDVGDALTATASTFFTADRWFGLGLDIAVGGVVAIFNPVAGAWHVVTSSIPRLIDFTAAFMNALVDISLANGHINSTQAARLRTIIGGIHGGTHVAFAYRRVTQMFKASSHCDMLMRLNTTGTHVMKPFSQVTGVELTVEGAVVRDSINKSVSMFCKVIKHGP